MTTHQAPDTSTSSDGSDERAGAPSRPGPGPRFLAILGVLVLLAGAFAYLALRHRDHQPAVSSLRVSGIPADIPTPLANLMTLSPVPVAPAPDFTLVDQGGRSTSLRSFRGRGVVLEFMDSHCVDICPIVSQEFVDAYHDLGAAASRVVFMAVNVNRYHAGVADVASFSRDHQLDTIPSWHFFTGPVSTLEAVWRDYGIVVEAPNPNADILHTSTVYFIDPSGRERYVAAPMVDHTEKRAAYLPSGQLSSWGQGIAQVSESLTH